MAVLSAPFLHSPWDTTARSPRTHYRLGVANDSAVMAENVEVWLDAIRPRPRYPAFRADFPYQVLRDGSAKLEGRGCRVNPESEQLFEFATLWVGGTSNDMIVLGNIDTKVGGRHAPLVLEDGERLEFEYRLSAANAPIVRASFSIAAQGMGISVRRVM